MEQIKQSNKIMMALANKNNEAKYICIQPYEKSPPVMAFSGAAATGRNFQFRTHGIVIYIFSIYQKSKFFSLLKKLSLSSLQLNHIYFSIHLQINHMYFSVLQTQYKKQIGLFIILKSR